MTALQYDSHNAGQSTDLDARQGSRLISPGDPDYADAARSWNLLSVHRPAAVFRAECAADVVAAVRYAAGAGLGVAVLATGHGTPSVGADTVLVNTSAMTGVRIDSERGTATVGAGARWRDVHARSAAYRLVGVSGSSSQVGVVGFTVGGGFGWLSRRLGFAASWVRKAEVVTADGRLVCATAQDHSDLLWALAGRVGNLGVIASLTFDLHPLTRVYGGNLYFPLTRAREVLECYRDWSSTLPREFMSALALRRFPPAPTVPEPLRGLALVAVRACYSGLDLPVGAEVVDSLRRMLPDPVLDTFGELPATDLDSISLDPTVPVGAVQRGEALTSLDDNSIDALLAAAGPHSGSPFVMLELRQLGGALDQAPRGPHPMAATSAAYTMNAIGLAANATEARDMRERQDHLVAHLGPSLTGSTYLNFLDGDPHISPERVRAAYTADDYARLRAIKRRYDPTNVICSGRPIPPQSTTDISEGETP
ncbi:MAG: FAD-binding oxidoreductase [Tetrasphaera sp.]